MIYAPRDYQDGMKSFIQYHPRCGIWAGMGVGKSVATGTALAELDLVEEVFPALVIAPLRVAQSTWPDEFAKWAHLQHLRISAIVGTEAERIAALAVKADVYTINYENLVWLRKQLGERWPFVTVVADEATKLKGFRLRQGGKRTRALGQVAHKHVRRFIELTGTPASNGLKDLWGQSWFLDKGDRLGRTYTAFSQRWFHVDYDGYGLVPFDHAQKEIQDRMRDICISIRAADYMDLPPLIENVIEVDLPPKVMSLYRDMEKEMFAEINNVGVEAFNAAGRTNKLLQLCNGAIYTDDAGSWEEVHQAKLDALEDVIEEAAGMPVLVSYQFKTDLVRICQRFKFARQLDTKPQTIRDWNAGRIPLLVCHPASAGHGLNLQYGSNILCYFSSGWNLEEDMQILERIGPTRQKQAGLDREVYVHRIVVRGTVDELVAERRATKMSVQEILLNAMKRRGGMQ